MQIIAPATSVSSASTAVDPTDSLIAISLSADPESHKLLINLTPPTQPASSINGSAAKRSPLDICCVIDVSGSMSSEAPMPGDPANGGRGERTGLSVLDVVKHSLRTIVATMKEDDRIALVTFSDRAKVVADLTKMTTSSTKTVLNAIERLHPNGTTNLWDGLKTGMNLLHEGFAEASGADIALFHRLSTLFILTDGMPNVHPPRGYIPMLKSYLDAHSATQPFSISTFGFGYEIDTPLLLEISQVGGGGYGFIPDSGMVGTVFVHAVANAYSTYAPRAKLDVEFPDGTDVKVCGGLPVIKTSWGVQIDAGDIQFGQSRNYVLTFSKMPTTIVATARYRPFTFNQDLKSDTVVLNNTATLDQAGLEYHMARLELVEILFAAKTTNLSASIDALEALQKSIIASPILANHADALAVAQDVSGEGLLALQIANFGRWGRHYFPSLARGHQRQQCGNFKDPGLQVYGRDSPVFIEERDKLDAAFDSLPPPTPSTSPPIFAPPAPLTQLSPPLHSRFTWRMPTNAPRRSGQLSMASYRSSGSVCFAGHCLVTVSRGTKVRVEQLKRGMEIMTLKGPRKVAALVRTSSSLGEELLCCIGDGLEITPWHPIRAKGHDQDAWIFPTDIAVPQARTCDAVYSILLVSSDKKDIDAHSVFIGGVWCVTLGHGLTSSASGDIRAHSFFGSYEKVLKEISSLDGFCDTDGAVMSCGTKRAADGRICGFISLNDELASGRIVYGSRNIPVGFV